MVSPSCRAQKPRARATEPKPSSWDPGCLLSALVILHEVRLLALVLLQVGLAFLFSTLLLIDEGTGSEIHELEMFSFGPSGEVILCRARWLFLAPAGPRRRPHGRSGLSKPGLPFR